MCSSSILGSLCFSLLATVLALHIKPTSAITSITQALNQSLNISSSILRPVVPPLNTPLDTTFACSGLQYGYGLNVSWGPRRSFQDYDIGFPKAYWSSDLACVIIPILAPGHDHAIASIREVATGASTLIQQCANNDPHRGGLAQDLSPDHSLGVILAKYSPPLVQCFGSTGPVDIESSCQEILNKMEASTNLRVFASEGSPGTIVKLPKLIVSGDGRCALMISQIRNHPTSDLGTWEMIWEDAALITAQCIRAGKAGVVSGLGKDHRLAVTMSRGDGETTDVRATA